MAHKFLARNSPYREHMLVWATRRAEAMLKRRVAWKQTTRSATFSAELRRMQNKDLETEEFQNNVGDLLSSIPELHPGLLGGKATRSLVIVKSEATAQSVDGA